MRQRRRNSRREPAPLGRIGPRETCVACNCDSAGSGARGRLRRLAGALRGVARADRAGTQAAGTSLLWACETDNEPIPQAGDIEIVVDHRNEPAIVTRITSVCVVPFDEVSAEYAAIEGEGDGSLDYWRDAHLAFFARECRRIGREPAENMPVVCSIFDVLTILPRRAA